MHYAEKQYKGKLKIIVRLVYCIYSLSRCCTLDATCPSTIPDLRAPWLARPCSSVQVAWRRISLIHLSDVAPWASLRSCSLSELTDVRALDLPTACHFCWLSASRKWLVVPSACHHLHWLLLVDWLFLVCISIFLDALRDVFNLSSLYFSVLSIAFSPTIHVSGGVQIFILYMGE